MCYELEYWQDKQRAEESRRQEQKQQPQEKPAKQPAPETGVKQPDPVPV